MILRLEECNNKIVISRNYFRLIKKISLQVFLLLLIWQKVKNHLISKKIISCDLEVCKICLVSFADVIKTWFLGCKLHIIQWQVTNCYYFSRGIPWYKSQLRALCRTRDSRVVFTPLPSCFADSENQTVWRVNDYCPLIDYRTCWTKRRSMKQIIYIDNFTISWEMIINISQCYELRC